MKFQKCHAEGEGAAAQRGDLRGAAPVSTRGMCLSVSSLVFLFAKRTAMKKFCTLKFGVGKQMKTLDLVQFGRLLGSLITSRITKKSAGTPLETAEVEFCFCYWFSQLEYVAVETGCMAHLFAVVAFNAKSQLVRGLMEPFGSQDMGCIQLQHEQTTEKDETSPKRMAIPSFLSVRAFRLERVESADEHLSGR